MRHDIELHEIIDEKLTALMLELQNADWSMSDVAFAIRDVLKTNWLDEAEALRSARKDVPPNFVSDGHEG
jgi:hypothetical protein